MVNKTKYFTLFSITEDN